MFYLKTHMPPHRCVYALRIAAVKEHAHWITVSTEMDWLCFSPTSWYKWTNVPKRFSRLKMSRKMNFHSVEEFIDGYANEPSVCSNVAPRLRVLNIRQRVLKHAFILWLFSAWKLISLMSFFSKQFMAPVTPNCFWAIRVLRACRIVTLSK